MDTTNAIILLAAIAEVLLLIICIIGYRVAFLKRQLTDMQVVTLIGLGVDNSDILQLTDMSKRTYYKRRQLIAQRMNTTAALLDEAISPFFTLKLK